VQSENLGAHDGECRGRGGVGERGGRGGVGGDRDDHFIAGVSRLASLSWCRPLVDATPCGVKDGSFGGRATASGTSGHLATCCLLLPLARLLGI
jgi:hypothetical protein